MYASNRLPTKGLSSSVVNTLVGTFGLTIVGLLLSAISAQWAMSTPAVLAALQSGWTVLGLFIVAVLLMFATRFTSSTPLGLIPALSFMALMGVMLAPTVNHYLGVNPTVVYMALYSTAAITAALALYVIVTRRDFGNIGGYLFIALIGLVVVSLLNIFFQSSVLHLVLSYIGAVVFSGFILHDTSKIVTGEYDNYIDASIGMYLNIINLFSSMLGILGDD
jgi:modulator of FtsH protease